MNFTHFFQIFFKELSDAQRAVEGGSAVIDGKRCNCNLASSHVGAQQQQQQPLGGGGIENDVKKIFVGGISPTTTKETVHAAFAQYGEVAECKLIMDQNTGFSKGYGFVCLLTIFRHYGDFCSIFLFLDLFFVRLSLFLLFLPRRLLLLVLF